MNQRKIKNAPLTKNVLKVRNAPWSRKHQTPSNALISQALDHVKQTKTVRWDKNVLQVNVKKGPINVKLTMTAKMMKAVLKGNVSSQALDHVKVTKIVIWEKNVLQENVKEEKHLV